MPAPVYRKYISSVVHDNYRIRRILREDVRKLRTELKCGKYVFIARPAITDAPHAAVTREIRKLLSRAKLLKEDM